MPVRSTKAGGNLAGLVASDSEPDLDGLMADASVIQSAVKSATTTAKRRGRPPTSNRVNKPAPKKGGRQAGGKSAEAAGTPQRQPLTVKANVKDQETGEGAKDTSADDLGNESQQESNRPRPGRPARGRAKGATSKPVSKSNGTATTKGRTRRDAQPAQSQDVEMEDVDESGEESQGDAGDQPGNEDPSMLLGEQAGESDVDNDPDAVSLRRRLGVLNKKYESLESRHRDLREVGIKEAERNYDRLRRQTEESAAASNQLIAQLKRDLAAQTERIKKGDQAQKKLDRSEEQSVTLKDQVAALNKSLTEARTEIKTLSTKLAASRSAEAGRQVPGSAFKANSAAGRSASSEVVQTAQAKEDLYADLTGLIVRGVKRGEQEDVFDCIQTGRNGTLHFKLVMENADAAENYEDVELTYVPLLDKDRDAEMMEVLPDYLVEEITFPRPQASKFYARVIKSLTERAQVQ